MKRAAVYGAVTLAVYVVTMIIGLWKLQIDDDQAGAWPYLGVSVVAAVLSAIGLPARRR